MRVWSLIATVVIGSLSATTVLAQATATGNSGASKSMTIAVVDIGYILKNHPTMKSEMESIQAQMEAADKQMTQKRDDIVKQMERMREQFTEGTSDYDKAEKGIAEQDTAFRLDLVKKRKEFEQAQANVLYNVYTEINGLLAYLSESIGTQVVLRVNREKMDPKKPETVQMVMSQDVLYFNESVDLTKWILDALQARATQTANVPAANIK